MGILKRDIPMKQSIDIIRCFALIIKIIEMKYSNSPESGLLTHTNQSFSFFLEVFRGEIPEGEVGLDPLIPHGGGN